MRFCGSCIDYEVNAVKVKEDNKRENVRQGKTRKWENKYILTTQDQLTKFCIAYPLSDTSNTTIADIIVNKFIYTFGSPMELLSDQGSNISGEVMKEVARIFQIKQIKTIHN